MAKDSGKMDYTLAAPRYQPVHVASDCYGPGRNVTVDCPPGTSIRVRQVSLGMSKDSHCPKPATWNVPVHCCTPACDDCLATYDTLPPILRQCDGKRHCDIVTRWRRMPYSDIKCYAQLSNYMVVTYACVDQSFVVRPRVIEPANFTKSLLCRGVAAESATPETRIQTSQEAPVARPRTLASPAEFNTTQARLRSENRANDTIVTTYVIAPDRTSTMTSAPVTSLPTTRPADPTTTTTTATPSRTTTTHALRPSNITMLTNNSTYNADMDNLGNLAKSEAMIYGSTAAAAVFILLIGILVSWLFCRRRFVRKDGPEKKRSPIAVPIYAYSEPPQPVEPNFYHDYIPANMAASNMAADMRVLQMACPTHHDYWMPQHYIPYASVPPASMRGCYSVPTTPKVNRRHESFSSLGKVPYVINIPSKKKTPTAAKRLKSCESYETESSVDDYIKPEFKRYVPISEALDDDGGKTSGSER